MNMNKAMRIIEEAKNSEMNKEAQPRVSETWSKVMEFLDRAKASAGNAYNKLNAKYTNLTPKEKALINMAGGTLAGGTIGGLVGGKNGVLAGSVLGGGVGAASGVDWKDVINTIKSYNKASKKKEPATADTK